MLSEKEIIEIINREIPSGPGRLTSCFESDAERLEFDCKTLLFSTDEFSGEDLFSTDDPYTLGWNIAAGSITDILASGGLPQYFANALVVTKDWDKKFIEKFCHGIRDVLIHYGVTFIGGDIGVADKFRCTASVIGKTAGAFLSRLGASADDSIYLTGKVGRGNFIAAMNLLCEKKEITSLFDNRMRFCLRREASELVRKYAACCIDTSDGVFGALNCISDLNSKGFSVSDLPYIDEGKKLAAITELPISLLFLGACGEYELLFTVNPNDEPPFLEEAKTRNLTFYKIGRILGDPNKRVLLEADAKIDLCDFDLDARTFENRVDYVEEMVRRLMK